MCNKVLRDVEDKLKADIRTGTEDALFYMHDFPEQAPIPMQTAEEWFVENYRKGEKQKDPSAVVRSEMAQKKWREMSEEDKKPSESMLRRITLASRKNRLNIWTRKNEWN